MNLLLQTWSAYLRISARFPALRAIVPFVPLIAAWTAVTEMGVFPRAFLPGPLDVIQALAV